MTRLHQRYRGMTIGTVLLLVTVGSLAVFTMVAMAFFHLRFSNAVVNQRSARNIAESALATALTRVWENNNYGMERLEDQIIHLSSSTDEEAQAFLSFSKEKAQSFGVPFSTNNFEGAAAVEGGNGRVVPDSAVHLVALGICGGSRYRAEVLYYVPPYPNALACTGPIVSTGGLLVAGIPSVQKATEVSQPDGFDANDLEPGHIMSNSGNNQAIFLGPESVVRGDVVAVGGVTVSPTADVAGQVRPNSSAQTIPDLGIDEVFMKLEAISTRDKLLDSTLPDGTIVDYFTEVPAPLTVNGDLLLDGGVLYCKDDLIVQGAVRGNGAIFSQGDVRIEAGADLEAEDQVALVARGSLELYGTDKTSQFFNGLVYSETEILAKKITVIGATIVNGDEHSQLQLDNVTLVKSPTSVSTVIGLPKTPEFKIELKKNETKKKFAWFKEKIRYSFTSEAKAVLGDTLTAGMQMSGMKVDEVKGEGRFNILLEGVFTRGLGAINGPADLTVDEQGQLQLDTLPHYFRDGKLYVRYGRVKNATSEEVNAHYNSVRTSIKDILPAPVTYKVKKKSKTKGIFTWKKKTSYENAVFDPAENLHLDVPAYLKTLKGPNKEAKADFIDLDLNRVIDPVEKSRILLWQNF